jgi:hypothetical protein
MRVLIFVMAVVTLAACANVERQFNGMQIMLGPCRTPYKAWQHQVETSGSREAQAAATGLLSCMRSHGVEGPIALVVRNVYGATPPPSFGPGKPRRDLDVQSLDAIATHYNALPQ